MKSDVCKLDGNVSDFSAIFEQVEKTAAYNNLAEKPALQLRLLAEELVGMLPELLVCVKGEFWIESENGDYELHACLQADEDDLDFNEKVLAISTSGKNAAARGIMGKIAAAALSMLHICTSPTVQASIDFYSMGNAVETGFLNSWSLGHYRDAAKKYVDTGNTEAWDELEKSIVAKVADNVVVGVVGAKVDIVIKKHFD